MNQRERLARLEAQTRAGEIEMPSQEAMIGYYAEIDGLTLEEARARWCDGVASEPAPPKCTSDREIWDEAQHYAELTGLDPEEIYVGTLDLIEGAAPYERWHGGVRFAPLGERRR